MARGVKTARAAPIAALAVAIALLPGALGLVLPIEHSFDGRTFFKAGTITFGDDLLIKQRGVGTYERPPLSAEEVSAAKKAVEKNGRYFVRVFDDSISSEELPLASVPATAWAGTGGAPALSLSLLSHGGVGAVSIDAADASAAGAGVAFPSDDALGRSSVSRTRLSFPEASPTLRGAAAAAAATQAGKGAPAPPAEAAALPTGGAAPAAAADATAAADAQGAPRDESEMTPEERKAAELKRKKEEWEKKSWIEKNWMMLIPAGLMFLNRWLSSLGKQPAQRGAQAPRAS